MSSVVFFDLETSSALSIGQILNYAFVTADAQLLPGASLVGTIAISRLELPSPGAIRANHTHVLRHQESSPDSEYVALGKIHAFLREAIARGGGSCTLVGYNSNKFDIGFLRTSFVRNGFDPYFGGKLVYRDLLQLVRKLSCAEPKFPHITSDNKLVLTLERVAQEFQLLDGEQSHTSHEDVLLTMRLARELRARFSADVRTFIAYEALPLHTAENRGVLFWFERPDYEAGSGARGVSTPMTLLDFDRRSALWVDLDQFSSTRERDSIRWYNTSLGMLLRGAASRSDSAAMAVLAKEAVQRFANVTLGSFFTRSTCDIEQDIYRLDFSARDALGAAIERDDRTALQALRCPDAKELFRRYRLKSYAWGGAHDDRVTEELRAYGRLRYGGSMLIDKITSTLTHPTIEQMRAELAAIREREPAARERMNALEAFYDSSDLHRVGGLARGLSEISQVA